jgi:gamma-glutamyltranspeptidase/glutathione hydrolase
MLSSMSPTIVTGSDGKVKLVLGAAGGPTIITAVFQTLSNVLDHGVDVTMAAHAPRFHMQHLPDVVMYEPSGIRAETKSALEAMGYSFKEREHIADAPAIGFGEGGWIGVAEARRKGTLAIGR